MGFLFSIGSIFTHWSFQGFAFQEQLPAKQTSFFPFLASVVSLLFPRLSSHNRSRQHGSTSSINMALIFPSPSVCSSVSFPLLLSLALRAAASLSNWCARISLSLCLGASRGQRVQSRSFLSIHLHQPYARLVFRRKQCLGRSKSDSLGRRGGGVNEAR